MILNLINSNSKLLRTPCELFDFENPPFDPIEFAKNLTETMIYHKGLGLSAPQVGVLQKIMVILTNPVLVMFNPALVSVSIEREVAKEGCLSFPELFLDIERHKNVRVRYRLPNGETNTSSFDGLTARVVQHEIEHLHGFVFTGLVDSFHLQRAKKNAKIALRRLKRKQREENASQ